MLYILTFFLLIYFVYVHDIKKIEKNKKRDYVLLFVILFLVAGLRYRMAPDSVTFEYEFNNIYTNIGDFSLKDVSNGRYPIGWYLLNSLFYSIGSYVLFQLFCSLVSNILVFSVVRQLTEYSFTVILFYFFFSYFYLNMDVIREFLAVSLELYSFSLLIRGKKNKSIIIGLLGPLIHSFSVFFFLIIILMVFKPSNKKMFVFLVMLIGVSVSYQSVVPIILEIFPGLSTSFFFYLMADVGKITIFGYLTKVIIPIFLIYIIYYCNKRNIAILKSANIGGTNACLTILVAFYSFLVVLRWNVPYIERLFNYFLILNYIIFAKGFYLLVKKHKSNVKIACLFFVMLVSAIPSFKELATVTDAGVPNVYRYYPYNTIFEKANCQEREQIIENEQRVYY